MTDAKMGGREEGGGSSYLDERTVAELMFAALNTSGPATVDTKPGLYRPRAVWWIKARAEYQPGLFIGSFRKQNCSAQ